MKELVTRQDLTEALDKQTLKLTVLFGSMLMATVGIVLAVLRFVQP